MAIPTDFQLLEIPTDAHEQHHCLVQYHLYLCFRHLFEEKTTYCPLLMMESISSLYPQLHVMCHTLPKYTKLTPLTPFFSLSSINNDRYSGDLLFRFRKYSKSAAIICLKILSLLKELWRKWSNLSFRSNKFWKIN